MKKKKGFNQRQQQLALRRRFPPLNAQIPT